MEAEPTARICNARNVSSCRLTEAAAGLGRSVMGRATRTRPDGAAVRGHCGACSSTVRMEWAGRRRHRAEGEKDSARPRLLFNWSRSATASRRPSMEHRGSTRSTATTATRAGPRRLLNRG